MKKYTQLAQLLRVLLACVRHWWHIWLLRKPATYPTPLNRG